MPRRSGLVGALPSLSVLLDTTGTPRWRKGALPTPTGLASRGGGRTPGHLVLQRPQVRKIQGSVVKKTQNQATYPSSPQGLPQRHQALLELRQRAGTSPRWVLEDVYEQFGTKVSPEAIKAFLEGPNSPSAAPSPRYVLPSWATRATTRGPPRPGWKDWLPGFPVKQRLPLEGGDQA